MPGEECCLRRRRLLPFAGTSHELETFVSLYLGCAFHMLEPGGKELLLFKAQQVFPILRHFLAIFGHSRDLSIKKGKDEKIIFDLAWCFRQLGGRGEQKDRLY